MEKSDSLLHWGHAKDYVRMQWMMLQQDKPEDFVIATSLQYSVREFITWLAAELGVTLEFTGSGIDEIATVSAVTGDLAPHTAVGNVVMRIDPRYFRPAEVETLLGQPRKCKVRLGVDGKNHCTGNVCRNGGGRSARRTLTRIAANTWYGYSCEL
jgi:GDPmannose 4,6-dehydratase